jgi:hypothetical protein
MLKAKPFTVSGRPPPWLTDVSILSACNFMLGHMLAFPETFFSYTLVQNFEPSLVQLIYCVMYSPWIMKPLYAVIIDRGHFAAETYIQGLLPLSAVLWMIILLTNNLNATITLFMVDALVVSFADVALDQIMVKRSKFEDDQREIQSHVLIWRSVGMMVGAYTGGIVMDSFGSVAVFACVIVSALTFCAFAQLLGDVRAHDTPVETRVALRDVLTPKMRGALLFTFAVNAVPDIGGLYDFFLIDELKFQPVTIGSLDMIGYIACTVGAYAYSQTFRGRSSMKMVRAALLVIAIEGIIPISLVLRWNVPLGISDVTPAGLDGFFRSATQRMIAMPLNGAIMPYCAPGHEGTVYALFTSLGNVATIVGMMLGSALSEMFGLSRQNMSMLWVLFVIRGVLYLALTPFAKLLPDDAEDNTRLSVPSKARDRDPSNEADTTAFVTIATA